MASLELGNLIGNVNLFFRCVQCGNKQKTNAITIPIPDYNADDVSASERCTSDQHECPICHKVYEINLSANMNYGFVDIIDLPEGAKIGLEECLSEEEEAYYDNLFDEIKDEIKEDRKYIDLFHKRMASVQGLIVTVDKLSEKDQNILFPMLYVNMIASMEAYLADTFIRSVLESEENKRKFVETFKDFEKEQISLQRIYEKMDGMDKFISKTLRDVIYHNLGKVKGMYKDALGVDLGDIKELMKAVNKRHDIVHRNCKDKEGNDVIITKTDVEELFELVKNFVDAIDVQVHPEPTV